MKGGYIKETHRKLREQQSMRSDFWKCCQHSKYERLNSSISLQFGQSAICTKKMICDLGIGIAESERNYDD